MYTIISNDNYGWAVATYGDYVAVSNPPSKRWSFTSASTYYTGGVDYFRYNKSTDQHDYVGTLYKKQEEIDVILITESSSLYPMYYIECENTLSYANYDLLIDKNSYTASADDGFGWSLDMYSTLLAVGSPYFTQIVITSASVITASGGTVEVHDLSRTEFIPLSQSTWVYTVYNPDTSVTNSFGRGVSINSSWLAVGSPYVSSSQGMVYMYRNISTGSNYSWSLFQKIEASGSLTNGLFGKDLKLNKQSGSYSQSLVVGCGNISNGQAYYFEFVSGSWRQTFVFLPTTTTQSLTFDTNTPYNPYHPTMSSANGFGYAVSTFENTVTVGAYKDRTVYEFSGSNLYQQGSLYIFERCLNLPYTHFELVLKTYGTDEIMKNNRLGYSVDIFGRYALAGIPKVDIDGITSCYLGGTTEQLHDCSGEIERLLHGQAMLLHKNTSSNDWEIVNIYQRKKRFLSPYKAYGYDVSIDGRSMVVGAPLLISDSNRYLNLNITSSSGIALDDITGKAYIYNLANLKDEFHVGNVFYRNGKIVLMTSGSAFDGLFFNPVNTNTYEYYLQFQGQHTIYEKQIICPVSPGEFNVSTNPSAVDRNTSSLDINGNGVFDFQDVDIILRYMQYKYSAILGVPVSTEWSASIIKTDDERSLYNYYISQSWYNPIQTSLFTSQSIINWEFTDTWMQTILDVNHDNKIDIYDMNIMWKYFANRLTQDNYTNYTTPACTRKLYSDIVEYMDSISQRKSIPSIKADFLDYERSVASDKTGSYLAPMATTIGLYSGLDLVAIAKLGSPIKIIPELPINFVVKMDF